MNDSTGETGLLSEVTAAVAAVVEARVESARAGFAEREADMIRRAYRRGYIAGRASQRRGAPAVTNPERAARTWVRETLA